MTTKRATKAETDAAVEENLTALELSAKLPPAGEGRFWRVRHIPVQREKPMRVELHEAIVPGSTKLSRVIGFENAVASVKSIVDAAELARARSGDYAKLVGDYR